MRKRLFLLLFGLCAARLLFTAQDAALAQSAPVWRCGNAYSHQPCAQGAVVNTQDGRTTEQREQARAQAEQTRDLADTLHRENAAREAQQRKEDLARQKLLLKEQAALLRAQRKTQATHDKPARQSKNRRPAQTRQVSKPLPNATTSGQQR